MELSAGVPKGNLPFGDSLLEENTPAVTLPVFDGPLDLLLFLIRKNEIDIYDIPVELVTSQYLEILYAMEDVNLDLAGEFFVMASTVRGAKANASIAVFRVNWPCCLAHCQNCNCFSESRYSNWSLSNNTWACCACL